MVIGKRLLRECDNQVSGLMTVLLIAFACERQRIVLRVSGFDDDPLLLLSHLDCMAVKRQSLP